MKLNARQTEVEKAVDAAREAIVGASTAIHEHPELGGEERFASDTLVALLEKNGFRVERGTAGIPTAFKATKGNGKARKVAFLAEYDALPEIGHGCGHNLISGAAVSAGIGLGAAVEALGLDAQVIVYGTPAEETNGAKVEMARKGVFDGLDAALMIHPNAGNYYLTESLALDALELEFFGKTAHAAAEPWEGRNALDAMILTFTAVNALRQQIRPDARIHGIITDGGAAPNVIPEHSEAHFYLRAARRDYLDELNAKFEACVKGAAAATGTSYKLKNYETSFDEMRNNETLAERVRDYFSGPLGGGAFKRSPESFGSIDMGNVSRVVPAVHVLIDIGEGKKLPGHTREFCAAAITPYAFDEMIRAGKALALAGLDIIEDSGFRDKAKAEFEAAKRAL
jgi:amidohydrolase